jgi:hypothetical protein
MLLLLIRKGLLVSSYLYELQMLCKIFSRFKKLFIDRINFRLILVWKTQIVASVNAHTGLHSFYIFRSYKRNPLYSYVHYIVMSAWIRSRGIIHLSRCILVCRLRIYTHFYIKMTIWGTLGHPNWLVFIEFNTIG